MNSDYTWKNCSSCSPDNKEDCVKCEQEHIGCECCSGDVALYYRNNENNAFIDSKGEMLITVKDKTLRFSVKYCPNCGRKF